MNKNRISYLFLFFFIFFNFSIVKSDSIFDLGKEIFLNKANCATCHTLVDAGSVGQIGPNLNQIRPDKIRVIAAITNGIGVMPAYQGELSIEEIDAVSHYVSISASQ